MDRELNTVLAFYKVYNGALDYRLFYYWLYLIIISLGAGVGSTVHVTTTNVVTIKHPDQCSYSRLTLSSYYFQILIKHLNLLLIRQGSKLDIKIFVTNLLISFHKYLTTIQVFIMLFMSSSVQNSNIHVMSFSAFEKERVNVIQNKCNQVSVILKCQQ